MLRLLKSINVKYERTRNRLFWIVVCLIIIVAVMAAAPFGVSAFRAHNNVSKLQIHQRIEQAEIAFSSFLKPAISCLNLIKEWELSGSVGLSETQNLKNILVPFLKFQKSFEGIILADNSGLAYYIFRTNNTLKTRFTNLSNSDYDPRTRPWFVNSEKSVSWTKTYKFTSGKNGVSGSLRWNNPNQPNKVLVAAVDFLKKDINTIANNLSLEKQGCLMLFNNVRTNNSFVVLAGQNSVADKSFKEWNLLKKPINTPFKFKFENQVWWAEIKELSAFAHNAKIGIVISKADLYDEIQTRQFPLLGAAIGFLILGAGLIFYLAKAYSRSLKEIVAERKLIQNSEDSLRTIIKRGEGHDLEFKSTLRMNLKTKKVGKEIELAWLKAVNAFINTDGGTLLIGVDDSGNIFGIDADGFENEDKFLLHFNNLFNQHIGLELTKFIRFELRSIENKKVLIIECEPSIEPVFLNVGKQEEFYIRVGPSSRKLTTSQILDYMKNRS